MFFRKLWTHINAVLAMFLLVLVVAAPFLGNFDYMLLSCDSIYFSVLLSISYPPGYIENQSLRVYMNLVKTLLNSCFTVEKCFFRDTDTSISHC